MQFVEQCLVIDAVEALGDIGIKHVLGFQSDAAKDGFDRIVAGPSRAEAVAVRLEPSLPFRFHRQLDEGLCRAIAGCSTVVVSAVGHERDVPLCDLVADQRASTPTDAARLIVPDARQELENVERLRSSARRCAERVVVRARERLEALAARPALRSADYWVISRREALGRLRGVLDGAPQRALAARSERAEQLVARLRAVAPQATLERGYAIVIDERGHAVRDAAAIAAGERVDLRLARGAAGARIEEVRTDG